MKRIAPDVSQALAAVKARYLFTAENMSQLAKKYGRARSVNDLPDWMQEAYDGLV